MSLGGEQLGSSYSQVDHAIVGRESLAAVESKGREEKEGMKGSGDGEKFHGNGEKGNLKQSCMEVKEQKEQGEVQQQNRQEFDIDKQKVPLNEIMPKIEQKKICTELLQFKPTETINEVLFEQIDGDPSQLQNEQDIQNLDNSIQKQSGEIKQMILDFQQLREKAIFTNFDAEEASEKISSQSPEKAKPCEVSIEVKIKEILEKIEGVSMEDIKYMSEKEIDQCYLELKDCEKNTDKKPNQIVSEEKQEVKKAQYCAYPHMSNQNLIDAIYPWMEGEIEEEQLITYTRKELENLYGKLITLIQRKNEGEAEEKSQPAETMMNIQPIKKKEKSKRGRKRLVKEKDKKFQISESSGNEINESSFIDKNESSERIEIDDKKKKKRGRKKKQSDFIFDEDQTPPAHLSSEQMKTTRASQRKISKRDWSDTTIRDIGEIRRVLMNSVKPHLVKFVKELDDAKLRQMYLQIREQEKQQPQQMEESYEKYIDDENQLYTEYNPTNQFQRIRPSTLNLYQFIGEYESDSDNPLITAIPRKTRILNDYSASTQRADKAQLFHHLDGLLQVFKSDDEAIKIQP